MTRTVKLAVIPGDGIGPEVIREALRLVDVATSNCDVTCAKTHFLLGAERYLATGEVLPDEEMAAIAEHDAILFGAVGGAPGDPRLSNANIERVLILRLRFAFDQYVNIRPTVLYPGVSSPLVEPGEIDFLVVREGTEGLY